MIVRVISERVELTGKCVGFLYWYFILGIIVGGLLLLYGLIMLVQSFRAPVPPPQERGEVTLQEVVVPDQYAEQGYHPQQPTAPQYTGDRIDPAMYANDPTKTYPTAAPVYGAPVYGAPINVSHTQRDITPLIFMILRQPPSPMPSAPPNYGPPQFQQPTGYNMAAVAPVSPPTEEVPEEVRKAERDERMRLAVEQAYVLTVNDR